MRDFFYPQTLSIRVPNLISKLVAMETSKRCFFKKNGHGNENEFFNKMLPGMLAYRSYKKGCLRDYLVKSIKESITEGMQEKILDFLSESFDYLYFDENEYDDVINMRFDTKNESLYAELFVRLDNIGIKRSSYIRNLIVEYLSQSEYQKERICFSEEYNALSYAIEQELVFQFRHKGSTKLAYAMALEFSVKREHWYLLYFEPGKYDNLYSLPLYEIRDVLIRHPVNEVPPEALSETLHLLIENGEFDEYETYELRGD